jgi:hypothetical protein
VYRRHSPNICKRDISECTALFDANTKIPIQASNLNGPCDQQPESSKEAGTEDADQESS